MKNITGLSATNLLTIKPDTGAGKVIIKATSLSLNGNYIIKFDGVGHIKIFGLRFIDESTKNAKSFLIENSHDIEIENNHMLFTTAYNKSYRQLHISTNPYTSTGDSIYNLTVRKNTFINGYSSLNINQSHGINGVRIENNLMDSIRGTGVFINNTHSLIIRGNEVYSAVERGWDLFQLHRCNNFLIENNKIEFRKPPSLVYMRSFVYIINASASSNNEIRNNYMTVSGAISTYYLRGIRSLGNQSLKITNNTIYADSFTHKDSRLIEIDTSQQISSGEIVIKNNLLLDYGKGMVFYLSKKAVDSNLLSTSTHNNIFSKNKIGIWGSTTINNFSDWKNISKKETSSLNIDPILWRHKTYKHRDYRLVKKGDTISFKYDIDSNLRNVNAPNIGCYEESFSGIDIAVTGMIRSGCTGIKNVSFEVLNNSSITIDSFKLAYAVDSGSGYLNRAPQTYIHTLLPGKRVAITLPNYSFSPTKKYTIKVISSKPNGLTDTYKANDTIVTAGLINNQLGGYYKIGGTGADFSSLNSAISALKLGGMCSPVTLALDSAVIHTGGVEITAISGLSKSRKLTITTHAYSNKKAVVIPLGSVPTILLRNVSGVFLLNIELKCHRTKGNVNIIHGHYLTFENCLFSTSNQYAATHIWCSYTGVLYQPNTASNITIKGNTFDGGARAIGMADVLEYNNSVDSVEIVNNRFSVYGKESIWIEEGSNLFINGNYFYNKYRNIRTEHFRHTNIFLDSCFGKIQINANEMIYKDFKDFIGISLYNRGPSITDTVEIINNSISDSHDEKRSSGIYAGFLGNMVIANNSIAIKSLDSNSTALWIGNQTSKVLNNILFVDGQGYAFKSGLKPLQSNYNIYYGDHKRFALIGNTKIEDLASFQKFTNDNLNSYFFRPPFTTYDSLKIAHSAVDSAGLSLPLVKYDIDSVQRNSTKPDIGAFEVSVTPCTSLPYNVQFQGVSFDTLLVQWNTGGANQWLIEYGAKGFPKGGGTKVYVSGQPRFKLKAILRYEYDFYIKDSCSNSSTKWAGPFTGKLEYCKSAATSQAYWLIDKVTFNKDSKTSGTSCAVGTTHSGVFTTVKKLKQYPFEVDINNCSSSLRYNVNMLIYIDYNNDYQFDASELVYRKDSINKTGKYKGLIQIPSTANLGKTGMRVIIGRWVKNACSGYSFGETEDFTINILGPDTVDADIKTFTTGGNCFDTVSIYGVLYNSGLNVLSKASLRWGKTFNSQPSSALIHMTWTGSLKSGDRDTVFLGKVPYKNNDKLKLLLTVDSVNSLTRDNNAENDTSRLDVITKLYGWYSISKNNGYFKSFNEAITAIRDRGICNGVTFYVGPGTYSEVANFSSIQGLSETKRIRFLGDTVANSKPNLTSSSGNTVYFDHTKYFDLEGLHIQAPLSNTIHLHNGNHDVVIKGNEIEGVSFTGTSTSQAVIYEYHTSAAYDTNRYVQIIDNDIRHGNNGILVVSSPSTLPAHHMQIVNNRITGFSQYGIYLRDADSVTVKGNYVKGGQLNSYEQSLRIIDCLDIVDISNNQFIANGISGGIALWIQKCSTTVNSARIPITNNFFSHRILNGKNVSSSNIVTLKFSENLFFANNSAVNDLTGTQWTGNVVYIDESDSTTFINNALANYSGGSALALDYWFSYNKGMFREISNNCYYSTGDHIDDDGDFLDLTKANVKSSWMTQTGDTSIILADPKFFTYEDLHIRSLALDRAGKPLSLVTDDFDYQRRDTLNPDIGADEILIHLLDAELQAHDTNYCENSTDSIRFLVTNVGKNKIDSLGVGYSILRNGKIINSGFKKYKALALDHADDTVITLQSLYFSKDSTYLVKMWFTNVNNKTDDNQMNDTTNTVYSQRLSGDYTVGGTSPDFATLETAVSYLNNIGICSSVRFLIRSGKYVEDLSFKKILGVSNNSTVTFLPDSGKYQTVNIVNDNAVLKINGSEYVSFLKLVLSGTSTTAGVNIEGYSNVIRFDSCHFKGGYTSIGGITIIPKIVDSVIISNCRFDSSRVINAVSTSANKISNIRIENNKVFDCRYNCINLGFVDSVWIVSNSFYSNTSTRSNIVIASSIVHEISNNLIYQPEALFNHSGIVLKNTRGPSGSTKVFNNSIYINDKFNQRTTSGIYIESSKDIDLIYNSIYVKSTYWGSRGLQVDKSRGTASSGIKLFNNTISIDGEHAFWFYNPSALDSADYNNYYVSQGDLGVHKFPVKSLADWKTTTGQGSNSLNVNPHFASYNPLNPKNGLLNNSGKAIPWITDDIQGVVRNTAPDIGALEFTALRYDAALLTANQKTLCFDSLALHMNVRNAGIAILDSLVLKWIAHTPDTSWSIIDSSLFVTNLLSGSDTILKTPKYLFNPGDTIIVSYQVDILNQYDSAYSNNNFSSFILVHNQTRLMHNLPDTLCANAPPIALTITPSTLTIQAKGIYQNKFYPDSAGLGVHALRLHYTDSNLCFNEQQDSITIVQVPIVSFVLPIKMCLDDSVLFLNQGQPIGGKYFLNGTQLNSIDPKTNGQGLYNYKYSFIDSNGCSDSAFSALAIYNLPNVTQVQLGPYCKNTAPIVLSGGSPAGGKYSGDYINLGVFYPDSTQKIFNTIYYEFIDTNQCSQRDSVIVDVNPVPIVSLITDTVTCISDTLLPLTGGLPKGGIYSGTGVLNDSLNLIISGIGTHKITYTVTDTNSCISLDTSSITIFPLPTIDLGNDTTICASVPLVLSVDSSYISVYWSNKDTSFIDSNYIQSISQANTYYVAVEDSNNCFNGDSIEIKLSVCSGIDDVYNNNIQLLCFPNPVSNRLYMSCEKEIKSIKVYSNDGSLIKSIEVHDQEFSTDFGDFSTGLYLVHYTLSDGSIGVKKVEKQ